MKNLHFVGIGGIGMSGLAAAARDLGLAVSGSDRGAERPENRAIIGALKNQGIEIYPQDGSRFDVEPLPDTLIYSTAIEEDNPDFVKSGNLPRLHRSGLLRHLLEISGKRSIAITGSCGKSTVCCYLTEALENLKLDPAMLAGGLAKKFKSDVFAGNYRPGKGKHLVFEADESDKSLLNYGADYAIILNIGTDHYDKQELSEMFGTFLRQIRRGAVLTAEVYDAVKKQIPAGLDIRIAANDTAYKGADGAIAEYTSSPDGAVVRFSDGSVIKLPKPGRHMAINALCIKLMLEMLGVNSADANGALEKFTGVWRRDDFAGTTAAGAKVFDDYAHNPEKILSCLSGMRERCTGKLVAIFQPHGYKPFGFMEEQLFEYMEKFLRTDDRFILLEPFYAGGTSSFSPSAKDIHAKWQSRSAKPERFITLPDREAVTKFVYGNTGSGDIVTIMGARDNSLSDFAVQLCK
ncbi:MAG: hypothetical protein IKC89_00925 [Lentisphaeria bacterium]|nr:hypothetical protein [Lentisphaeria bacterium]